MSRMLRILQAPPGMVKRAEFWDEVSKWMDENPLASKMLIGGGIGVLGGAMLSDDKSRLQNALLGGLLGAGGGALYHGMTWKPKDMPPPPRAQDSLMEEAKKLVTPKEELDESAYDWYNKNFFPKASNDQVRSLIQRFEKEGIKYDPTKFHHKYSTWDDNLVKKLTPNQVSEYITNMLITGNHFVQNGNYDDGTWRVTGNKDYDLLLGEYYRMPKEVRDYMRQNADYKVRNLNQYIQFGRDYLKNIGL